MRKSTRIAKRLLALFLVVLMSTNTLGAIVSDNDGSAFITKAEFDSLKNDFQSQIDQYNTSIDDKIDGAITSYLAGIKMDKTSTEKFFNGLGEKLLVINSSKIDNIKTGKPIINWDWYLKAGVNFAYLDSIRNTNANIKTQRTSYSSSMYQFTAERAKGNASKYELFFVDKITHKLKYYTSDMWLTTNSSYFYVGNSTWANAIYTHGSEGIFIRWHAAPSGTATKQVYSDPDYVNDGTTYDPRFGAANFCQIGTRGINMTLNRVAPSVRWAMENSTDTSIAGRENVILEGFRKRTHSIEEAWDNEDDEKINLINDFSSSNVNPLCVNSNDNGKLDSLLLRDDITDNIDMDRVSDVPPNDISLAGFGFSSGNTASIDPNATCFIDTFGWSDRGGATTWDSSNVTAQKWHELQWQKSNVTNLINNISQAIIDEYVDYNWHGYTYEGIPIGIFKNDSIVTFDLDCSTFNESLYFALDTAPFSTTNIVGKSKPAGIQSWSVDGTNIDAGSVQLSNTNHKIKIDLSLSSKSPLFIKFGLNPATTFKKREIISLPKTYVLTQSD